MKLKNIKKYTPGFNIHDIQKKYKLKKVIKLASNENPFISKDVLSFICLLYTSPSPRDATLSRMPSSA